MQVDAGGEIVITQLFYDVEIFLKFVKDCRSVGIDVPIIPGDLEHLVLLAIYSSQSVLRPASANSDTLQFGD